MYHLNFSNGAPRAPYGPGTLYADLEVYPPSARHRRPRSAFLQERSNMSLSKFYMHCPNSMHHPLVLLFRRIPADAPLPDVVVALFIVRQILQHKLHAFDNPRHLVIVKSLGIVLARMIIRIPECCSISNHHSWIAHLPE